MTYTGLEPWPFISQAGTLNRELFMWLVDIPRICLSYVSFVGGRTVWVL